MAYHRETSKPTEYLVSSFFQIQNNSSLRLVGETNLNHFDCDCRKSYPKQKFNIIGSRFGGRILHFEATKIAIPIDSLDCGNPMMNKDLQNALNASTFPFISIELLKVSGKGFDKLLTNSDDWINFRALTRVSINGRSDEYWMHIKAKQTQSRHIKFIGEKNLHMSDFGVTPPTAMHGLIKVKDKITISLDMEIQVD